jgi:hypothetical protein
MKTSFWSDVALPSTGPSFWHVRILAGSRCLERAVLVRVISIESLSKSVVADEIATGVFLSSCRRAEIVDEEDASLWCDPGVSEIES